MSFPNQRDMPRCSPSQIRRTVHLSYFIHGASHKMLHACLQLLSVLYYITSWIWNIFFSCVFSFLQISSPFDSLDWVLNPMRVTASYSNEGLVEVRLLFLLLYYILFFICNVVLQKSELWGC